MSRRNLFVEIGYALGHNAARVLRRILASDDEPADDADERRRRALRKSADVRRCPRCGRSGALSDRDIPGDGTVRRCR